jgi:hypothetical protein
MYSLLLRTACATHVPYLQAVTGRYNNMALVTKRASMLKRVREQEGCTLLYRVGQDVVDRGANGISCGGL